MEWGLWCQGIYNCFQLQPFKVCIFLTKAIDPSGHIDVYEGTGEARVEDLSGIRQIIKRTDESGT